MKISKIELDEDIEYFINKEQSKFESENGISCKYTPFCFGAYKDNEIDLIGVISGASFFSEVYIDELVVKKEYRRQNIGSLLINTVVEYFSFKGFNNINLCTNEFQATNFYEKCGFELEFIRKNKTNPKLNKYFYIRYF